MKLAVLLCGVFIICAAPLAARDGERLTMRVSPSVAIAPADLVVRTTIEASAANRAIEIIAESDDFYRSSELPLDGGNAPKSSEFQFRSLPGGIYVVTALLKGAGEQPIASVRQQVRVVESPLAR
jgi:hypothetical protein